MINTILTSGEVRAPRAVLLVGSTKIEWTSFEIEHTGIHEAGTIRITMPCKADSWTFWTQQTEIIVDAYIGFPSDPVNYTQADMTLMMTARIDELRLDPVTATIYLSGRDLTCLLTDNKTSAKYPNLTSNQIVQQLLSKVPALTGNITPTSTIVGNYYDADQVQIQHQVPIWTLMTYLAQQEGFQCFVLGRTLYFGEFGSDNLGSALTNEPYAIFVHPETVDQPVVSANAMDLMFQHDLTIAGDISVTVKSYHGAKKAAYKGVATSTKTQKALERSAEIASTGQHFSYTFPGLTKEKCQAKAEQLLAEISQHEYRFEATVPGDIQVFPWTPITVSGTGTVFDATYQIARIRRTFDMENGYLQHMECRTPTPDQEITLS